MCVRKGIFAGVPKLERDMKLGRFFIVGGAGFIGSHFTDALLSNKDVKAVTLFTI